MRATTIPALAATLLLVAGCAFDRPPSVTQRDTVAACRQHADTVYDRLHRNDIYSISQTGLPLSSTGGLGDPNYGLQQQFEHERMIDNCVRNTGAGTMTVGPKGQEIPTIH